MNEHMIEVKIDDLLNKWEDIPVTFKMSIQKGMTIQQISKTIDWVADGMNKIVRWGFEGSEQGHYSLPKSYLDGTSPYNRKDK